MERLQIYVSSACVRSAELRARLETQPIGQAITWTIVSYDIQRSRWGNESGLDPYVPTLLYKGCTIVEERIDCSIAKSMRNWDDCVRLQQICVSQLAHDANSSLARLPPHAIQLICACLAKNLHDRR